MVKAQLFLRIYICALLISSCAIEIDQPIDGTSSPGPEGTAVTSPTSSPSTTQIPVTWSHLNLTGRLVYLSSTTKESTVVTTIQMLDLVTGGLTTLFRAPDAWVYYASISPDSKTLVMSYVPPAQPNSSSSRILYEMPLDGTDPPQPLFTPPTPDDRYIQAEWSPDGKYIYYVHYNNKTRPSTQLDPVYDIARVRYPDGQPEQIVDHAFWLRISSDSSKLVYVFVDPASGRNELFLADADGSNPQPLALSGLSTQGIIDAPIFSPDGQTILFSVPTVRQSYQPNWFERFMGIQVAKAHDVPSDWWSVPVGGGAPVQLTNLQTINLFASISPDQRHIASLSGEGIFLMDVDGSNLTQLISDPGVHGTVSWIP
jgi:Tol biopolymer transport system component